MSSGKRICLVSLLVACSAALSLAAGDPGAGPQAKGPLRVCPKNPRYFADGTGRAVYLTGSHTWGNLCDPPRSERPPFDYPAYLDFLGRYNHNFFRLWAGDVLYCRPSLYVRAGPGQATDGAPRVDLARLNQEYFDRLRARVVAARDRGIYAGIMLFRPDMYKREDWPNHLFNPANNVQELSGDTNGDGAGAEAYDLSVPRIVRIQEEYVRKVVDTVNDLDNVLYEIGNEGDRSSVQWQYQFLRFIEKYEGGKPRQHPIGMTASVFENEALFKSPADWVSPSGDSYIDNPPASDGSKVILVDTDHLAFHRGDPWKCFLRGLQFVHMDFYDYGKPYISVDEQEAMRQAMGQTRRLAERLDLASMTPRDDLASTKYCLAQPGVAYVVYVPTGGEATVDVSAANKALEVEWIEPVKGTVEKAPAVPGGARHTFRSPFTGGAVLYLRRK